MIRVNLAGAVLFLAIAACAGAATQVKAPQAKQDVAKKDGKVAANEKNIVCRMERPTGSNIPERVCSYIGIDQSDETQRTQDMLRGAQRGNGPGAIGN
jgi:hypothetical protein